MTNTKRTTQEKERVISDKLFSLMADLVSEIEELPEELQKNLNKLADKLLDEIYSQARLERCLADVSKKQ